MEKQEAVLIPTDFVHQGQALARLDGQVVFVEGGIPGEEVLVEIVTCKKDFCRAEIKEILQPSPHRVVPPCAYFEACGGCQLQHVEYSFQCQMKERVVADQLRRIGGFAEPPLRPIAAAANPWNYRNKGTFSRTADGRLGFTRPGTRQVMTIDECMLMHPAINEALKTLQGHARGLHQVMIRHGFHTGQTLISPAVPSAEGLIETGQPYFEEELLGRRYRITGEVFFQVNTLQAERLAGIVIEAVAPQGDEVLLDVYCGVGTFGLLLAPKVKEVVGIEDSRAALRDAGFNAQDLDNITFIRGQAEKIMPSLDKQADVILIDPPRAGCRPEVIEAILKSLPEKVIYVSCDPATLARDLRMLCAGGYDLVSVQPVDMFPQTFHTETVARIERL